MITCRCFSCLLALFVSFTFFIKHDVWSSPITGRDVSALVNKVDSNNLVDTLGYLTSFGSRASYEVQVEVIDFLADELDKTGATIWLHEYEYDGRTWHNLVATVPGNASLDPGEPHIVVDSDFKACRSGEDCDVLTWSCIVPSTKEEVVYTSTRVTPLEIRYQRVDARGQVSGSLMKE